MLPFGHVTPKLYIPGTMPPWDFLCRLLRAPWSRAWGFNIGRASFIAKHWQTAAMLWLQFWQRLLPWLPHSVGLAIGRLRS